MLYELILINEIEQRAKIIFLSVYSYKRLCVYWLWAQTHLCQVWLQYLIIFKSYWSKSDLQVRKAQNKFTET